MTTLALINSFLAEASLIETSEQLSQSLRSLSAKIGFAYFALTHHVNFGSSQIQAIRLHNYPEEWVQYFDSHGLGLRDPVHRASQLRGAGFSWSSLADLIALDNDDIDVLERARRAGIGEGYTVPFHVPGEYSGSCSFATAAGTRMRDDQIPYAQLLGSFAFEAARRLHAKRYTRAVPTISLTPRQRECVVWLGQGKSEWEVGKILGLSQRTVNEHLKRARERCGVSKSALLVVHALVTGSISYDELLAR